MSEERKNNNVDWDVVNDFGSEWEEFQFSDHDNEILKNSWNQYFNIFPWDEIKNDAIGFDMGCGTGRWAQFVAPKVGKLSCIDPSVAIEVAKKNLAEFDNIEYYNETSSACSLQDESQDFGYSLGVLHHIPSTQEGINDCAKKLKPGAPFLLYLYYNFENKSFIFRSLWHVSDMIRKIICRLPLRIKKLVCSIIALAVYLPLAKLAGILEKLKVNIDNIPLSDYRNKSFYIMKNDALDRFGTKLEQRFSRAQIKNMLENAGFENIKFSNNTPFWTCISYKK